MIKNFKRELGLISNNKRINEKLMVIAIYNEFFNDVMDAANDNSKDEYTAIIEKTFEATVRYFNVHKTRNVNAERFMSVYFNLIRKNEVFNKDPLYQVIYNIENKLADCNSIMGFVNVIDDFDELLLDRKVGIMLEYREYANNLLDAINEMFGYNTIKSYELHYSVLSVLKSRLANYLNHCKKNNIAPDKIIRNLKVNMIKPVKNFLFQKVNEGSLGVQHIEDDNTCDFLNEFQDLEIDIWFMEYIYEITGCNKYAKSLNINKTKEICEFLGISKLRYTLTNISMGLRSISLIHKLNNPSIKR